MIRGEKLRHLLVIVGVVALMAAACGGDDDSDTATDENGESVAADDSGGDGGDSEADADDEPAVDGGSVSNGIVEPSWIDSFNVQDDQGFQVSRLLFDGLTDLNPELEAVPAVASEWATDDNITWTFTLRDDVMFHNGEAVTAQSFVDGFNRAADPANLSDVAYYGSGITAISGWADVEAGEADVVSGVTAVDDTTLEIVLDSPYALLPKALAHPVFAPVDLAAVEAGGDSYSDAPVGNGPYMMDGEWEHDVSIDLVRYDDYYGDAGTPDAIRFNIYDGLETMYLEAQAGNLDISDVPPESISTAEADFPDRFVQLAGGSYTYLGFPTALAPFDDVDIRRALSMAIDRETITQEIFSGDRAPADGFAPSLAPGAVGGCQYTSYDPEAAKELFDAAGGLPSGEMTMYFNSGGGHEAWTEAVANGWLQTFGFETQFVAQEFAPYLDQLQAGEVDGPFRLGWIWDLPSAENFLTPLFLSTSANNYTEYVSPEFDAAVAEFKDAPTEQDGFPALAEAQEILCDDMPVAPIYFGYEQRVYSERVDDVNLSVFGYVELENVTVVG